MFRFDAKTGYYLYPESEDIDNLRLRMNKGSTYEANVTPRDDVVVTKHGLRIPAKADNYDAFVLQIKASEDVFRQEFTGALH